MLKGLIGKKIGMTQIFDDKGVAQPVTIIEFLISLPSASLKLLNAVARMLLVPCPCQPRKNGLQYGARLLLIRTHTSTMRSGLTIV